MARRPRAGGAVHDRAKLELMIDKPIHPAWFLGDHPTRWWACSHPERPGDDDVVYSEHCHWCVAKFRIDVIANPELLTMVANEHSEHYPPGHHKECPIADILATA